MTFDSNVLERRRCVAGDDFVGHADCRDFLREHLAALTDKQRSTLLAWSRGNTPSEIAAGEGVSPEAIHSRIQLALGRLRRRAGIAP